MREKKLYRVIECITAGVILGIVLILLLVDNRVNYVYQTFCAVPNLVFAGGLAVLLVGYCLLKKKRLTGRRKKGNGETAVTARLKVELERRNLLLMSVILLGVQLVVAWQIYFKTGWDCGKLVQMAQEVAFSYRDIGEDLYFSMYPNNVLLVAVFAAVLRFVKFLGFQADYFPLVMIGCLLVNLAGFFMADCVRKMTRKNWLALFAWVVYIVLAGLSPWISIPYSDTYSILFPVFCFWLYLNLTEKNQYVVWFLIGFAGWLGSYIKPTVMLLLLVLLAVELWRRLWERKDRGKGVETQSWKKGFARFLLWAAVVACGIFLAMGLNGLARYKMGCKPDASKEFTPVHYLMMGLNYKTGGTYDQWDVNYSSAAPSVAARNEKDLGEIRARLSNMGVKGLGRHLGRKLLTNFNDGTFAWGNEGEFYWNIQEKNTFLATRLRDYYYESGKGYGMFVCVAQAFWILTLCLAAGNLLKIRRENIPDREKNITDRQENGGGLQGAENSLQKAERAQAALMLGLLAIICFVMVFEARARYLFLYSPLFILAAVTGLERFLEKVSPGKEQTVQDKNTVTVQEKTGAEA